MMAVRDVKVRNFSELRFDLFDRGVIANRPGRMAHTIRCGEIDVWLVAADFGEKRVKRRNGAISQKNWARLRIQSLDVPNSIIFFVWAREFVLLDNVVEILLAARCGHQAELRVP